MAPHPFRATAGSPTASAIQRRVLGPPKVYPNMNAAAALPVNRDEIFHLEEFFDNYRLRRGPNHAHYVPNSKYVFVRTGEGSLLLHPRYRHPVLAEGKPVLYAGEISFRHGQLEWWSNASGNYRPDAGHAEQARLPMENFYTFDEVIRGVHRQNGSERRNRGQREGES